MKFYVKKQLLIFFYSTSQFFLLLFLHILDQGHGAGPLSHHFLPIQGVGQGACPHVPSPRPLLLKNGEEIAYRERLGGEKNVILVHGNMSSSLHWEPVFNQLDVSYKVYAPDLRGFGDSSYYTSITTIKQFAEDLKLFVDSLKLTSFALIGWSLGGAVCQQYCIDYPGDCWSLFLLSSGSTRGFPVFHTQEGGLPDLTRRLYTLEEIKADGKTKMIQQAYEKQNTSLLKQIWNMLIYTKKQPENTMYQKYLEAMMAQRNLAETYYALNIFNISSVHNGLVEGTNQVKDIKVPVLIAWGEEDLVVTKQMTDELITDYGEKAQYVQLHGCGHSPQTDDVKQLVQVMEEFLAKGL